MTKAKKHLEPNIEEVVAKPPSNSTSEAEQSETEILEDAIQLEAAQQDEIKALQTQLAESQAKANEYLDGWQRAMADFANYKKRVEREQTNIYQNASGNVIKRYLDVLDDLDRALKNRPMDGDGATWANGVELIYRKFLAILESEGVTLMRVDGETFDPNLHEAISLEDHPEYTSGQVIEVLKQGYVSGDRVLRPALVRVAK